MSDERYGRAPKLEDFGDLFAPAEAAEPILGRAVRQALMEWLTEIWAEAEILAVGVAPRRRAIFSGPSGTGKTTLAHHLSARLGLRMLAVRIDRLVSKYVGETSRKLGMLFDLASPDQGGAADEPVVLFFDEFDALTRQRRRGDSGADDARNEEVDTMLQRIDQFPGYLIAATNHAEHIDQAIWRRFDIHVRVDLPGPFERQRILQRYFAPYRLPREALRALAEASEGASPALLRQLAENVKRTLIVGPKLGSDMSRAAVFSRVLNTVHPHPDLGKPRLWSQGAADPALAAVPWPLSREGDADEPAEEAANVVDLRGRG